MNKNPQIESIDQVQETLKQQHYIADRSLATSIFLALKLGKPLFLEGEAGVGKTEIAKVLAAMLNRQLIRLQCYEGLDVNTAVYEWNYTRQMLEIRLLEAAGRVDEQTALRKIFGPEFLLKRPLLQAIEQVNGVEPVLLVDELDRADEDALRADRSFGARYFETHRLSVAFAGFNAHAGPLADPELRRAVVRAQGMPWPPNSGSKATEFHPASPNWR